ncbi:MAG: hypothetical protein OQK25_02410 [Gammaproteobacteria bacterium]|nr:hypothetical protein [Gammaproteobacteria bacterium]MCW8982467.1 hypothetical protein [Gammaproteobacteria bacterium]
MKPGDIFVVPEEPSPENDVANGMYPVYGVIIYVDEYDDPETSVFSAEGKLLQDFWYFHRDEIQILEEA